MAEIIWTEAALHDLEKIAEYIALDNPAAAKKLVQQVFTAVERLEQFPNSGRKIPELPKTRYHEIVSSPCRIFYRMEQNLAYILFVMRSERNLRKFMIDERVV